jgi:hypothetical protein
VPSALLAAAWKWYVADDVNPEIEQDRVTATLPVSAPVQANVESVNGTPTRAKNIFQLAVKPFGLSLIHTTADVDVMLVAGRVSTKGAAAFTGINPINVEKIMKKARNTQRESLRSDKQTSKVIASHLQLSLGRDVSFVVAPVSLVIERMLNVVQMEFVRRLTPTLPKDQETIVTSLRIPKGIAQTIKRDAETSGVSFNALIMKALLRYAEWDRFTQKIGFVSIPREMLKAILEAIDQQSLDAISKELASSYKESILLWFKEVNIRTFLEFFRIASAYSGLLEYDLKSSGNSYTITIHHQLGEKWSKSYPQFAQDMFKSCLGVTPDIEIGKNHAVIRFSAP